MQAIQDLVSESLADFRQVASLARLEYVVDKILVEVTPKPHKPPASLPLGRMAVYAFLLNGRALKVGKVGAKSQARYTSQHYSPASAMSTLARSILTSPAKVGAAGVDASSVGDWIRRNTDRVNLLLPATFGVPVLSLLEAFLHVRWKPLFEGRAAGE